MELSRVGLVSDFEDGIGRQLSAFRCGPGGCMKEIQERVTQAPNFGQYQFAGIRLRNCQFTARSCASTGLRDRRWAPLCRKQTSSVPYCSHPAETNFVDAAKVNLRKHRIAVWRAAVPNLGVTCPPFFRCEAPRFTIRHTQEPARPTVGPPPEPAMRAETDSGSTASAPSGIRT